MFNVPCRQVALADLLIINKTDLVKEEELSQTRDTVRSVPQDSLCLKFCFQSFISIHNT